MIETLAKSDRVIYHLYVYLVTGPPVVIQNDSCTWEEIYQLLYEDGVFDNIVISPGPGSPSCPADIGILFKFACLNSLLS